MSSLFEFAQKNNEPQAVEYIEDSAYPELALKLARWNAPAYQGQQLMFCFKTDFQNTPYNPGLTDHMDRLESSEEWWDGVPDED